MSTTIENDGVVVGHTSQGQELKGAVSRLTRHGVVFEIPNSGPVLRVSEVVNDFSISLSGKSVYFGRAVIRGLVATNLVQVCEATLDEGWLGPELAAAGIPAADLSVEFQRFLRDWHGIQKIEDDFKVAVADLQSFLADMRLWLDRMELGISRSEKEDSGKAERALATQLGSQTCRALDTLFDPIELLSERVQTELQPVYRAFTRRQLHALLMCSPFLHRTFFKPLGYAGDYEMVNMVIRDPYQGSSLYAKLVNHWFLQQAPAEAHRNRIDYLLDQLKRVTADAASQGRKARILSLGCGPAGEVQRFISENHFADQAEFTLIDFNEETIQHTSTLLAEIKTRHHCQTAVEFQKRSVNQILKESVRTAKPGTTPVYDLVYCAGLYDYLTDQVCRRVSNVLFDWTVPGGLFVATNVDVSNPRKRIMDFVMDWHLIYRDAAQLKGVRPDAVMLEDAVVKSDSTGVNLFMEVRKAAT